MIAHKTLTSYKSLVIFKSHLLLEMFDICLIFPDGLGQGCPRLLCCRQAGPQPLRLRGIAAQLAALRLRMRQLAPQLHRRDVTVAQLLVVAGLQVGELTAQLVDLGQGGPAR